jgi:hypothetical protein
MAHGHLKGRLAVIGSITTPYFERRIMMMLKTKHEMAHPAVLAKSAHLAVSKNAVQKIVQIHFLEVV